MSQSKDVDLVVRVIAQTAVDNEKYFCELDGVVGDGDFGYSLARGFERVLEDWDQIDHSLPGNLLKKVSSIIVGRVGGVSGTIWGTAFLRAGMALGTKPLSDITPDDVIAMFRSPLKASRNAARRIWATRLCWTRWCRLWINSRNRSTRVKIRQLPLKKQRSWPGSGPKQPGRCSPSEDAPRTLENAASEHWMQAQSPSR